MQVLQPIYKVLSALLNYPTQDMLNNLDALHLVITEHGFNDEVNDELKKFFTYYETTDLLKLEENYISHFDHSKTNSLFLFEHLYGVTNDRGPAMLELKELYSGYGFEVRTNELPDYIPLFLEFLSLLSEKEASSLLSESINIIGLLQVRLKNSPYQSIFGAIIELSGSLPDVEYVEDKIKNVKNKSIDEEWLEPEINFNKGAAVKEKQNQNQSDSCATSACAQKQCGDC